MGYLIFQPNTFGFPKGFIQYEERIFKINVVKDENYLKIILFNLEHPASFRNNYGVRDILGYDDCDFIVSYSEVIEEDNFQELLALEYLMESIYKSNPWNLKK